jgi:predicted AAA+ superfamily ATPase
LAGMNELKLKKGLIITEDKEGKEKIKGKTIQYIPLWKWLLQ